MRKNLLLSSLLLCALTSLYGQPAFASENWVGSWKLNAAKSNFGWAAVTRTQTLKFEATPAGIKLTSEGTDAQGKPMQGEYTSKFDGKDVAWTGNPSARSSAWRGGRPLFRVQFPCTMRPEGEERCSRPATRRPARTSRVCWTG
jgi:hypothetical protein